MPDRPTETFFRRFVEHQQINRLLCVVQPDLHLCPRLLRRPPAPRRRLGREWLDQRGGHHRRRTVPRRWPAVRNALERCRSCTEINPGLPARCRRRLLLQGLWSTAVPRKGEFTLGVLVGVLSVAALRNRTLPTWLAWLGIIAGVMWPSSGQRSSPRCHSSSPPFNRCSSGLQARVGRAPAIHARFGPDATSTRLTVARCWRLGLDRGYGRRGSRRRVGRRQMHRMRVHPARTMTEAATRRDRWVRSPGWLVRWAGRPRR